MEKVRQNLEKHMRELCLIAGSRHVGSAGERIAADYIAKVFAEYGYERKDEATALLEPLKDNSDSAGGLARSLLLHV